MRILAVVMKAIATIFLMFNCSLNGFAQTDSTKKIFYFRYSAGVNVFASWGAERAGYHPYVAFNLPRWKFYAGPLLGRFTTIKYEDNTSASYVHRNALYHGFGLQGVLIGAQAYPFSPFRKYKFFLEYCSYYLKRTLTISADEYRIGMIQNTAGCGGKIKFSKRIAFYHSIGFGIVNRFIQPSLPDGIVKPFGTFSMDLLLKAGLEYNFCKKEIHNPKIVFHFL